MTNDWISYAELARRANVSRAAVTRVSRTLLQYAVRDGRVDANHPDAVAYIAKRHPNKPMKQHNQGARDILYQTAIAVCQMHNVWTVDFIQEQLQVDPDRAGRIHSAMVDAGVGKATRIGDGPSPVGPTGQQGLKERKKQEAAAVDSEDGPAEHDIPEHIEVFADMTLRTVIERFGTDYRFVDWLKALQVIESVQEKRLKNAEKRGDLISRDLVHQTVIEPVDTAMQKLLTDGAKTIAKRVKTMAEAGLDESDIQNFVEDQIASFIRPMKTKMMKRLDDHARVPNNARTG